MTEPTTALVVRSTSPLNGYNPPPDENEFRGMIFMAKQLAEAQGFVPAHFYRQPSKILAAMLYGRDLGITPTNALQHIIVIDGKATADAQLIGMLVRRAGHRLEDKTTDQASTVTITRGDDSSVHSFTFTMQDASRAGLVRQGSAWQKYPQAMLYARALSGCARKAAQDALMGTAYTPEELEGGVEPNGEIAVLQASPETRAALEAAQQEPAAQQELGAPAAASAPPAASVGEPTTPMVPADSTVTTAGPIAAAPPEQSTPPPTPSMQPLGGASVNRRMGRSIGPAPKRTNTITVEPQAATKPATAPEAPPQPVAAAEPAASQPAPAGLTDEPETTQAPEPVDEGELQYRATLREELRKVAATLTRTNRIYSNKLVHAPKNEAPEEITPAEPNPASDEALRLFIERDFPGRTLENLGTAELQNRLEAVEGSLAKKRAVMKERGVTEE